MEIFKFLGLLYKAWRNGSNSIRYFIAISNFIFFAGITIGILNSNGLITIEKNPTINIVAIVTTLIGFIALSFPVSKVIYEEKEETKTVIENKEQQLKENPEEIKLAWDIASFRLEGYLKKNLGQVSIIFGFSLFATFVGLILISYGSYKAFEKPDNLSASIIMTVSGAVVNFLGATLLVIHKYTMEQANQYVQVLERINAVGMSVQIMETIHENESKLKEETKADIAKKLLELYGSKALEKKEEKKDPTNK